MGFSGAVMGCWELLAVTLWGAGGWLWGSCGVVVEQLWGSYGALGIAYSDVVGHWRAVMGQLWGSVGQLWGTVG